MCSFCIPRSFLVIIVCNQGKTSCSPCITNTYEFVDFSFSVTFIFSCNLTSCRLGDFDMIFVTQSLKSNIYYSQPQGQPPHPQGKILGAPVVWSIDGMMQKKESRSTLVNPLPSATFSATNLEGIVPGMNERLRK